jgi:small subunit ribosomal protein S20
MPIIKSAKKRVRIAKKAAVRNSKTKRSLRDALKTFAGKTSSDSQSKAQSAIDTAVKKGVIHKNKAARQKKRLAAQAKAAKTGVKKTAKKATPAKKPVTKKSPVKKAPARKK